MENKSPTDDRVNGASSEIYAYTNNNRGRPVLVTKDGVEVAAYTYDDDEQRVVKSLPDGTLVHYAYDSEGRLISETDGTTGDTIREYLWLGLTPIAVIAPQGHSFHSAANDNAPCDQQTRIDELTDLIAAKQARITTWQAELVTLADKISTRQDLITTFEGRIAALNDNITSRQALITTFEGRIVTAQAKVALFETRLAAVDPNDTMLIAHLTERRDAWAAVITRNQARIVTLNGRIATFQAAIDNNISRIAAQQDENIIFQTRITTVNDRITWAQGRITAHQSELDTLQAQCDAAGGTGTGSGGSADLYYLHTDHLGKPQFATDTTGTVIWDAGGQVTPFGDGINTAATFAQNLQFPGQYADEETGLSHNHHRTYDPALGRYLQSDPIGLAGGLNRYAYVGGNPVNFVDPTGELFFVPVIAVILLRKYVVAAVVSAVFETAYQAYQLHKAGCLALKNFNKKRIVISGVAGGFGGLVKGPSAFKVLRENKRYKDMISQVYKRPRNQVKNPKLKSGLIEAGTEALAGLGISTGVKKGLNELGLLDSFKPPPPCEC